jgi:hypothetical protein
MEHVFKNEEKRQLGKHSLPRGERNLPCIHAKGFGDRVEKENLKYRQSATAGVGQTTGYVRLEPPQ